MLTKAVRDALEHLELGHPDVPEAPTADDLAPWRDRIDAIDLAILKLLSERVSYAHVIGRIKKEAGLPVYVPSREEEVIRNVVSHNPGPLPDEIVRRLFERIIDETRSLERQKFQEED